ncbi:hypothetical protein BaRGS_00033551 [Batillaria attramentaria]|uniref:Uncharacterized protein n=1 Tax=Batillaria attramentaria TaxID=370345 RepID=A0ABD0JKF1_9CAEN
MDMSQTADCSEMDMSQIADFSETDMSQTADCGETDMCQTADCSEIGWWGKCRIYSKTDDSKMSTLIKLMLKQILFISDGKQPHTTDYNIQPSEHCVHIMSQPADHATSKHWIIHHLNTVFISCRSIHHLNTVFIS